MSPAAGVAPCVLEVRGLVKRYGPLEVLRNVDLVVPERSVVGLIGASGSGKSTLLRCMNHLERPTSGEVLLDGELIGMQRRADGRLVPLGDAALSAQRRRMSMVFQRFNLWPHKTALQNVTEALVVVQGMARAQAAEKGMSLLEKVGLADKANTYPSRLSGGQQQRVGIARALATEPRVLLFDEPTSALDPELVGAVLDVMAALAGEGRTMVVVTHEMAFAREICSSVAFLDAGAIVDEGPPAHIFGGTGNPRTLAFLDRYLRSK